MVSSDQQYLSLLASSQRQAQELQLLHAARSALARENDLTSMLHTIVEETAEIFGYSHVSVYLIEGDTLVCQHEVGYGEATIREIPLSQGVAGMVGRTGEPVLIKETDSSPEFIAAIPDITSEVCVPLIHEGHVVGILNIESTRDTRPLDETDFALMLALSEHMGIAIGRTRLLHDLRDSEERFRTLIEHSADGVILLDPESNITYASPSTEHILGWNTEEVLGKNIDDFTHPDDLVGSTSLYEELQKNPGMPMSGILRVYHKELGWRWCEGTASNMLNVPGVRAIVINYRDVTSRKLREQELEVIARMGEALRTTERSADMIAVILEQARDLVEGTAGALIMRSPESEEFTALSGYGLWGDEKVLGALASSAANQQALQFGEPLLNANPRMALEDVLKEKQRKGLAALTCIPLRAQHEIVGTLWIGSVRTQTQEEINLLTAISDIAANSLLRASIIERLEHLVEKRTEEIERANEELKELDQLKDRFIANVTHEFRTPVTNIQLYLDLLRRKHNLDGPYLTILQGEAARIASLVEDMLQLSHIQDAATSLETEPLELDSVVTPVIEAFEIRADARHLIMVHEPNPGLPPIQADRSKVHQIVSNLMGNAVSYAPEGGVITIVTDEKKRNGKQGVTLSVHNTGPAIPKGDIPHLFERFYRGRRDAELTTHGTGLGLAICKEIVDQHEGQISVESTEEAGTTFQVWLPMGGS